MNKMKRTVLSILVLIVNACLYSQSNDLFDVNYDYVDKDISYDKQNDIFQEQFMQYEKNIASIENELLAREEQKSFEKLLAQQNKYETLLKNQKEAAEKQLEAVVKENEAEKFNLKADYDLKLLESTNEINKLESQIEILSAELKTQNEKNLNLERTLKEEIEKGTNAAIDLLKKELTASISEELTVVFEEQKDVDIAELKKQLASEYDIKLSSEKKLLTSAITAKVKEENRSTTQRIKYFSYVLIVLFSLVFVYLLVNKLINYLRETKKNKMDKNSKEQHLLEVQKNRERRIDLLIPTYLDRIEEFKSISFIDMELEKFEDLEEKDIRATAINKAYDLYKTRKSFEAPEKIRKVLEEYYPKDLFTRWNTATELSYLEGLITSFNENRKKYSEKLLETYNTIDLRAENEKVLVGNIIIEKSATLESIAKQIESLTDYGSEDIRTKLNDLSKEYMKLFFVYAKKEEIQ